MSTQQTLGRRIRELRARRGLTLKDIEARVDVSATHVSEIERGMTSPTIGALTRIAEALRVAPSAILGGDEGPSFRVQRAQHRPRITFERDGFELEALSSAVPGQDLSAGLARWAPREEPPVLRAAEGEQFLAVFAGRLVFECGRERVELRAGDCLHFRADRPHRVFSPGPADCLGLWVGSPRLGI